MADFSTDDMSDAEFRDSWTQTIAEIVRMHGLAMTEEQTKDLINLDGTPDSDDWPVPVKLRLIGMLMLGASVALEMETDDAGIDMEEVFISLVRGLVAHDPFAHDGTPNTLFIAANIIERQGNELLSHVTKEEE